MRKKLIKTSTVALAALAIVGCGSGSDVNRNAAQQGGVDGKIHKLAPQKGTQSELFYGNSKHDALGSLSNSRVFDSSDSSKVLFSKDSLDVKYPEVTTALTYSDNNSYSNFHTQSISYVSKSKPYRVSMIKGNVSETANSSGNHLSGTGSRGGFSYQKINYLGAKRYLVVKNDKGDRLLITPEMKETDVPLEFNHKTLETVTYSSYGDMINGYIVINDADDNKSTTNELQKCTLDMSYCKKIAEIKGKTKYSHGKPYSSYDISFLGDIIGTTNSVYISSGKIYELNKADGTVTDKGVISTHAGSPKLSGNEIFYIENNNVYKSTLDGNVTQISSDGKATSSWAKRAFTNDMVIYGNDDYMYAVTKDGSLKDKAIELSITTKNRGQKYPFDLGIGNQYLYNRYSVNTATGKNTFYACKLENSKIECKEDSYWSSVVAAKDGILNSTSTYIYTPYAYIRVDDTDNYGGGKVKAIDPKYPLEDGITMGITKTYNLQTFVNSSYDNDMIDSDGNIVLYAKNDLNYKGNAFLMNLTKENSLVQLTDESSPEANGAINAGRDHCHGRKCTVCHSFAGGKIYNDKKGTKSAKNYTIRFDFEDGSDSILAKVRKGSGENFNIPLQNLVGKNFKPVVIDQNGTAVNSANGYYHQGAEYFNCNYCHGRNGDLKYGAPSVITIER